ncbi:hypothetical protein ACOMHN_014625 [Nucella lapillus]
MRLYEKPTPINCSRVMKDWVYTTNGTFRISRNATRWYGKITCDYKAIQRQGDFKVTYGPLIKSVSDGTPLKSEFFRTNCWSSAGKNYSNDHAAVVKSATVMKRLHDYHSQANRNRRSMKSDSGSFPPSFSSLNLSVFMFGFDSLSRMGWLRFLPKTRKYFLDTLGGIELENYNIVGDGTTAAFLPILTGKVEEELPESRRGKYKNSKPLDKHPWVWKDFTEHGYVTAYAEDMPWGGSFQWRMLGFQKQPTDHYMRPYHLSAATTYRRYPIFCQGSLKRHVIFMNYFKDLFEAYSGFPKFFVGFNGEISHDHWTAVQLIDEDMKQFMQDLEAKGYLNSTLLILMGDHGARFSAIRYTDVGKLEERLPYFSFRFPPWVHKHHPDIIRNMQMNAHRLTTPFDIHATFLDILNHPLTSPGHADNRSISLFHEVPKERTCADADIAPHWCACLKWEHVNKSDPLVVLAVDNVIRAINNLTHSQQKQCARLKLLEITKSLHARKVDRGWKISNKPLPPSARLFQISFKTLPGKGYYEVTCAVVPESRTVLAKGISRINRYGSEPACIAKQFPYLRRFCYCV